MSPDRGLHASLALVLVTSIALAGCSSDRGTPTVEVPVLGSIAGCVVTEAIAPIPGVNVTIPGNRTTTNTTGGFTFAGLAPGLYVVEASAATFLERQTTVQVTAGNISEVRLVLPVNASALAFHQAFSFRGFTDAHGGSGALLPVEPGDGGGGVTTRRAQSTEVES